MYRLVLLRHGESEWNRENRFTGWKDVGLSDKGVHEAQEGAAWLARGGYAFDVAFTSYLRRAIKTLWIVLEQMDQMWIPVHHAWQLNERHYGALQGLNKAETAAQYGDAQVKIWRRSYDTPPPALEPGDERDPARDPRYAALTRAQQPLTECLKDTVLRVVPYWEQAIAPAVRRGQRVIVAAHGNSLRALVKFLDNVSDEAIVELNIPTGVPLVYELDDALRPTNRFYLGDAATVAAAQAAVAAQGKAR